MGSCLRGLSSLTAAFRQPRWLALLFAGLGVLAPGVFAQPKGGADQPRLFTVPVYDRVDKSRLVARLSGEGDIKLSSQQVLETVRFEYFDAQGRTNLLIRGTNCVYDTRNRTASSPDPIQLRTGDGRLELQGQGFLWWQTNNDLVISNQVETTVRRPAALKGNLPGPTGDLRVFADRLRLNYSSNLITYAGRVRVEDPRLRLTCRTLTILRAASGGIQRILAQEEVVILDQITGGRTTADEAVYAVEEASETVELTGHPRWQEGVREGTADKFLLDRARDTLQAIGNARLVLPVGAAGTPGLLVMPPTGTGAANRSTNHLVEVTAALITIQLPATNGPVRGVTAETNVVLIDRDQNSRATAHRAVYAENGGLELTGDPVWTSGDRLLRGEPMRYDPASRVFTVGTNAFVRFPALALMTALASMPGAVPRTNAAAGTNHFIEIAGGSLSYRDSWLRFEGGVQGKYLEDQSTLGTLQCDALGVQYAERVRQVRAAGDVRLAQLPVNQPEGRTYSRAMRCETLTAGFNAEGHLESLLAEGQVDAVQRESHPRQFLPAFKRLLCHRLDARFNAASNRVETVLAETEVVLSQNDRLAQSDRAVYTGRDHLLMLTGNPIITLPEGRVTDADAITWDRVTGKFRITGRFRSSWKALPAVTNATSLLQPK